jgi:hypothetical protein
MAGTLPEKHEKHQSEVRTRHESPTIHENLLNPWPFSRLKFERIRFDDQALTGGAPHIKIV